jgi:hypothetical protein
MDRRQLPAVLFLTMSMATMCVAARPEQAHAATPGPDDRAGRAAGASQICRSWEHHGKRGTERRGHGTTCRARGVPVPGAAGRAVPRLTAGTSVPGRC